MGFTTSNLSLYHTFSKTPVDSNTSSAAAQLGNANNKSGHTVQSNEIWTESIPFFGLAATTTAIHDKFSATAKVNDLVKDADGKIWQRNSTLPQFDASGALTSKFADLWFEKTTSITSNVKVDGAYPTTDGPLVDGSYLLNSEGVPTVKYYEKRLLTRLTAENNANTNSDNKASRLRIDGKWIDQFIGATDIYLNGSAAVSYIPVLRKTEKDSPMQSGPGKGYMDYCATGLILWESSAAGTEVIDCFEYVGTKLDATLGNIREEIQDIIGVTMEGVVASVGTTQAAEDAGISVKTTGEGSTTAPVIDIETAELKDGVFDEDDTRLVNAKDVSSFIINKVNDSTVKTITINDNGGQLKETYDADENNNISLGDGIQKVYNINRLYPDVKDTNRNMGSYADDYDPTVSGEKIWDDLGAINYIRKYFYDLDKAVFGYGPDEIYDAEQKGNKIVVNGKPIGIEDTISYKNMQGGLTIRYYRRLGSHDTNGYWTEIVYRGVKGRAGINEINWTWKPEDTGWRVAQWDGFCYPKQKWDNVVYDADLEDMTVEKTASGITVKQDTGYLDSITVTSATYTPATETTEGSWENLDNVITGTHVKNAITEVHSKINALHETPQFTVRFVSGVTDLKNWKDAVEEGIKKNTIYLVQNPEAQDGSCVEYIAYESGNSIVTEKIGTTKTDLSGYVNKIATGQATSLANKSSVYANIASDGTLTVGVADASADGKGLVKLAANVADGSTTDVTTASAVKTYADTKVGDVEYFGENDLLSTKAEIVDGVLKITEQELTWERPAENSPWNENVTKLVNNEAFAGDTKIATVETSKIKDGSYMFYNVELSEFSSDLDSLTDGDYMFWKTSLETFCNDMSSLTSGYNMFDSSENLTTFIGDLSALKDGYNMFASCSKLTTFIGDLSSLTNGEYMFSGCSELTTFDSDLSTVTDGTQMFYSTSLSEFDSDLSSLTNGTDMFTDTQLSLESIECIAETIATNENSARITIRWKQNLEESVRQEYVDVLSRIVDKGWTLETNQELLPLFDSEKYETGGVLVQPQPLDLESEPDLESKPRMVYYVIKK